MSRTVGLAIAFLWIAGPLRAQQTRLPFTVQRTVATQGLTPQPDPLIRRHGSSFTESAVRVDNASLAHTAQLLAADRNLDTVGREMQNVFDQLAAVLTDLGSSRQDLVKLNVYAADANVTTAAMKFLSGWCPADSKPAVTTVLTSLPRGRRFAIDAVVVARKHDGHARVVHRVGDLGKATASVLPQGDVVYVSGQAKPGDLATATQSTLAGLMETLKFLKLRRADIVRVKCFLKPMSKVDVVDQEIEKLFAGDVVPAVSHVEWIAGDSRPIEIEIVAAAPETKTTETVSYHTPPDLKASPVFSRVARIHGNRRVYVSGLKSGEGDGAGQVHAIFINLIRQLKPTRANLRHLAKATYYVSDDDASSQLNQIRPHYYDPHRPPAASKAMVRGTGLKGSNITIDVIAAPEAPLSSVLVPISEKLMPTRKVVYKTVSGRKLHLHIFEPDGHQPSHHRPVFLAIHGGGWTGGNAQTFYPFAAHFTQHGMLGISLEYRLKSNEAGTTVLDSVRDARSAVRWIREHADTLGIDPSRIVAMGGSAGGHLAVATALLDAINQETDNHDISAHPDAMIMMYPVIDTSAAGYGQAKIGDRWRELSPVHNVRGKLPPALIFHGTGDDVTPYAGVEKYQALSTSAGNISELITHPGGRHGYIIFDRHEYDRALDRMKEFLLRQKVLPVE